MPPFTFSRARPAKPVGQVKSSPPEACGIQVSINSKISLGIPFRTKRDKEIRECVKTRILNDDGSRVFFFRSDDDSWTNVALESTFDAPALTAPPLFAVQKAYQVLTACPAVSTISIVDDNGNPLTLEQVRVMEFIPFEYEPTPRTDDDELAEAVVDLQGLTEKHTVQVAELTAKLSRAESEIQTLKTDVAKLTSMLAAGADPPAAPAAAPVEEPSQMATPPPKGRLARATEKKRTADDTVSEPGTSSSRRIASRKQ